MTQMSAEDFSERITELHRFMAESFVTGCTSLRALVGMACTYAKGMDIPEDELVDYVSRMFKVVERPEFMKRMVEKTCDEMEGSGYKSS
jgi:hypothetical protein